MCHPDKGGCASSLHAVKLAYKALSDPCLLALAQRGELDLSESADLDEQRMKGACRLDMHAAARLHPVVADTATAPRQPKKRLQNKAAPLPRAKDPLDEDGQVEPLGSQTASGSHEKAPALEQNSKEEEAPSQEQALAHELPAQSQTKIEELGSVVEETPGDWSSIVSDAMAAVLDFFTWSEATTATPVTLPDGPAHMGLDVEPDTSLEQSRLQEEEGAWDSFWGMMAKCCCGPRKVPQQSERSLSLEHCLFFSVEPETASTVGFSATSSGTTPERTGQMTNPAATSPMMHPAAVLGGKSLLDAPVPEPAPGVSELHPPSGAPKLALLPDTSLQLHGELTLVLEPVPQPGVVDGFQPEILSCWVGANPTCSR